MSEFGTKTYPNQECLTLDHDYVLVERGPDYLPQADIGETYADLMVKSFGSWRDAVHSMTVAVIDQASGPRRDRPVDHWS
jgi:hypothetical protein